jgi:Thiolase, C-terminal domain
MTKLLYHMRDNGIRYGLQTICEGGGQANATVLELLQPKPPHKSSRQRVSTMVGGHPGKSAKGRDAGGGGDKSLWAGGYASGAGMNRSSGVTSDRRLGDFGLLH